MAQAMIEKLAHELQERSEAVRSCGSEIMRARKQRQEAAAQRDQALKRCARVPSPSRVTYE
jgi:hypothetical protein